MGETTETLLIKKHESEEDEVGLKEKAWIEIKKMWVIAAPAIFTRFTSFGITIVTQAFIGHISPTQLAAYSLIFTVFLRFSNGILLGMASALETLCGQAFGAKQYHMLGIYLQRSWLVLTLCAVFLIPLFIFAPNILRALGQAPDIVEESLSVSLWFIPALFSYIASFTCQMFLQAQSKNKIISYLAFATLAIHIPLSWLLTQKYNLGLSGAMFSTVLAYWLPNIGQLLYVTCGGCPETWKGFSLSSFKDLLDVLKLSLSSGIMLCVELWYNTVLILLTGHLENAEVAIDALAICININGWELMISLGFAAAASVRVSNELGRGSTRVARFSILMIVLQSFFLGCILFVVFLFLRGKLAYVFTDSEAVANEIGNLSPLLALSLLLNSIQPVLSGVAIGAGWQSIVAYVNLICYYLVGIPTGVVLGYVANMQVKGVWTGMLLGTFVQTIVLIIITWKTDWDKQVIVARARVNKWFEAESKENNQNA